MTRPLGGTSLLASAPRGGADDGLSSSTNGRSERSRPARHGWRSCGCGWRRDIPLHPCILVSHTLCMGDDVNRSVPPLRRTQHGFGQKARLLAADLLPKGWGADLVMLSPPGLRRGESVPAELLLQFSPGSLDEAGLPDVRDSLAEMGDDKADFVLVSSRTGHVGGFAAVDQRCAWSAGPYRLACRTVVLGFPGAKGVPDWSPDGPRLATLMLTAQTAHFEVHEEAFNTLLASLVAKLRDDEQHAQLVSTETAA